MAFPHDDSYWKQVADFLLARFGERAGMIAPNEFAELFPRAFPYDAIRHIDLFTLNALVIHKGMLNDVGKETCVLLLEKGVPLMGNAVFVVYSLNGRKPWKRPDNEHFSDFEQKTSTETFKQPLRKLHSEFSGPATVILMTTYNRPERLARTLESVSLLGAPMLVVNDGSHPDHTPKYDALAGKFGLRMLHMPGNRGVSVALNAGLVYWLADPNVEWISYIQDDMEVRRDMLAALARVQDREKYPLLSGRHDPLQKLHAETEVNGVKVLLQRMCPGMHLHAHRDYWQGILPIPAAYFQAPRSWPGEPLRGADEDWWICQWSPRSIVKQFGYVAVLPGLARTTTIEAAESTWSNPGIPEPPLPEPQFSTDGFVPATFAATPVRNG